jgi:uncharacterized protein
MVMPTDVGVVDLMMSLPVKNRRWWAESMAPLLLDKDSMAGFQHAASYMFKDLPTADRESGDATGELLRDMDAFGIEKALIGIDFEDEESANAVRDHPDRLLGSFLINPNRGMEGVRALVEAKERLGVVAAAFFPCGCVPQVAIDDRKVYPFYAKCTELDLPIFINVGVPGPRVPMDAQKVSKLDKVCWFFPDLKVVMRHGAEPWEKLAVKLMVKWPNLHYSTSAFAPRYYPKAIVNFANKRGSDQVMFAGYYPSGLTLERTFSELADVPFRDEVWPKFLRTNALRVLGLER